jgi:hypothetical protein
MRLFEEYLLGSLKYSNPLHYHELSAVVEMERDSIMDALEAFGDAHITDYWDHEMGSIERIVRNTNNAREEAHADFRKAAARRAGRPT